MYPKEIEKFLLGVQKPGRYTGGELNSIVRISQKLISAMRSASPTLMR